MNEAPPLGSLRSQSEERNEESYDSPEPFYAVAQGKCLSCKAKKMYRGWSESLNIMKQDIRHVQIYSALVRYIRNYIFEALCINFVMLLGGAAIAKTTR